MAQLKDCPVMLNEVAHCDKALEYVTRFRTAVDGGAHRGLWTFRLLNRFAVVHAFEPRPEMADQISASAVVHVAALGAGAGECAIAEGRDNNGQAHVIHGAGIPVVALDDFNIDDLDFLKLDVEGFELMALQGALQTITRCRPVILLEQNGLSERYGYTDAELNGWLEQRGYHRIARFNKDHLFLPR